MKQVDQYPEEGTRTFFYTQLEEQVKRLEAKYPRRPVKTLLSLIFWSVKQLTASFFQSMPPHAEKLEVGTPNMLFNIGGGIGDIIIASTYFKELYKHIGGTHRFSIYTNQNSMSVNGVFNRCPWVERIHDKQATLDFSKFDAVIALGRTPLVIHRTCESNTALHERCNKLLQQYIAFEKDIPKFATTSPTNDTLSVMYALMNGHNRRSQCDIGHTLGLSDETRSVMVIDEDAYVILKTTGLEDRTYITIQRGVDENRREGNNTRLWLTTHYNELIQRIHAEFPSLSIVQVGRENPESDLVGIDVDLRGQTSFEELKTVLKQSALHIDGECGMVHLTHALGGRSAVFFGQTSVDFCGYPENINVKAKDACPLWCEWVTDDWQDRCLRGFDVPPCMEQLTPELFFDAIREHLHTVTTEKSASLREIEYTVASEGTILFIGDFEDDAIDKWACPENRIWHFSMKLTPESIQNKKDRQIDADYADILNIPMKKESCDAVFCSAEQHLSHYALREITRILKTGGMLKTGEGRCFVKEICPNQDA